MNLYSRTTFAARYDGKTIVPDEPLDLPHGKNLRVQFEIDDDDDDGPTGADFLKAIEEANFSRTCCRGRRV